MGWKINAAGWLLVASLSLWATEALAWKSRTTNTDFRPLVEETIDSMHRTILGANPNDSLAVQNWISALRKEVDIPGLNTVISFSDNWWLSWTTEFDGGISEYWEELSSLLAIMDSEWTEFGQLSENDRDALWYSKFIINISLLLKKLKYSDDEIIDFWNDYGKEELDSRVLWEYTEAQFVEAFRGVLSDISINEMGDPRIEQEIQRAMQVIPKVKNFEYSAEQVSVKWLSPDLTLAETQQIISEFLKTPEGIKRQKEVIENAQELLKLKQEIAILDASIASSNASIASSNSSIASSNAKIKRYEELTKSANTIVERLNDIMSSVSINA